MDLSTIADNIELRDGVWYAKTSASISYPEDGNINCLQIEENSFWFRHRNQCILEIMQHYPPQGPLFDVGGGNGFVANAMEKSGFPTVLVEPGEAGVINAQQRKLKNLVCSTLEDAEFKENSVPAIGVFDVVEHMEEDEAFLQKLFHYLQPDGRLYLSVPSHDWLWSFVDTDAGHHHRYTLSSLGKKLENVGFSVEFGTYFFTVLPLPIFLLRSIPSRLGMFKDHETVVKRKRKEHKEQGSGWLNNVWKWEQEQLKKGKKIGFGASCLMVAKKVAAKQ